MALIVLAAVLVAALVALLVLLRLGVSLAAAGENTQRASAARRAWTWEIVPADEREVRVRGRDDGLGWSIFTDITGFETGEELFICTREAEALRTWNWGRTGAVIGMLAAAITRGKASRDLAMLARGMRLEPSLPPLRESFVFVGSERLVTAELEAALVRWLRIYGLQPAERDSLVLRVRNGEASIDCTMVQRGPAVRVVAELAGALRRARKSSVTLVPRVLPATLAEGR